MVRSLILCYLLCAIPSTGYSEGITVLGTVETIGYTTPHSSSLQVPERELQGKIGVEGKFALGSATLSFDLDGYLSSSRERFADARIEIQGDATTLQWSFGLLRETLGRSDESRLNILTAPNFVFGLAETPNRVAQPGAQARIALGDNLHLKVITLTDLRKSPLPEANDRFSFGTVAKNAIQSNDIGHGAIAIKIFGSSKALDWGIHVFHGLSRDPTYIQSMNKSVTVQFNNVTQIGYDMEISPGDWRLWSEGFWRNNGRSKPAQVRDFGHAMFGAEYQMFAVFNSSNNLIVSGQYRYDSRGTITDTPFQNAIVLGGHFSQSKVRGWHVEFATTFDLKSHGRMNQLRLKRQVSEIPFVEFVLSASYIKPGNGRTLLNVFANDSKVSAAINWKF